MFAYDGWLGVGAIAGEMKNPKRDLPLAIGGGLIAITLIYVLINLVFVRTLPISALSGNLNAAADAALRIFGDLGGKLVTIGILISVYGAINGYTMTGMRVPFAMAEEDALPFSHLFKRLSPHTSVPYFAGAVQFGIALIMMLLGSFDLLTDMLVFVMWGFPSYSLSLFSSCAKRTRINAAIPRARLSYYSSHCLDRRYLHSGGHIDDATTVGHHWDCAHRTRCARLFVPREASARVT